jgi:NitT/TauT family transport system substrate-binding protein
MTASRAPRRRLWVVGVLAALLLVSQGAPVAPLASAAPPPQRSLAPLQLGTVRTGNNAPTILGLARGYWQELGIDLNVAYFDSGVNIVPALAAGHLDVAEGSLNPGFLNAFARGVNLRIVSQKVTASPGHDFFPLMVRKDLYDSGAVTRYADLRGRKIAVNNLWTATHYKLVKLDERFGLPAGAYEIVSLPYSDMPAALQNQAIDAVVIAEPIATRLELGGLAIRLSGDEYSPDVLIAMYSFSEDLVRNRPELGRAFLVGYLKSVREFIAARAQGGAAWEGVSAAIREEIPELQDAALAPRFIFGYMDPNGHIPPDQFAGLVDWYQGGGQLTRRVDLAEIYDPSFLRAALAQVGEVHP